MTISIAACNERRRRAGFTLVEMLVSLGLASMALSAVISSMIFIGRSCVATTDYADMDQEARRALEVFARDVRMTDQISNFSSTGVTLRVLTSSSNYTVTYTYRSQDKKFYRNYGTGSQSTLIKGVDTFTLKRYTLQQTAAVNDLETKQLQLELRSVRTGAAKAFASNNVISARFIMRNKIVSN